MDRVPRVERRLAAILAADVEGYGRLMGLDEVRTIAALTELRAAASEMIAHYRGRIVDTAGDSILAEFGSAVDAVECAIALQRAIAHANRAIDPVHRMCLRIGIDIGDVLVRGNELFGDGVNIAARLQAMTDSGGVCVSGAVYDQVRKKLPLDFADLGLQSVKNVADPVRAYKLCDVADTSSDVLSKAGGFVGIVGERQQFATISAEESRPSPALPDKPSIAVLAFQNMSGEPEQEYFADGMVEEIITALSRMRWLFVIARNSSFTYKGQAVDLKQVGRELGVRYVLEGSVRKTANRVRITAQLVDAENGAHLWADRFDGALDDIFALQDKVAASVAGVIEPTLRAAELRRSAQRPTNDLTAYDLYLRAYKDMASGPEDLLVRALDLVGQAIERDPHYGPALSLAAICHARLHAGGWTNAPEATRREGLGLARRALAVAGDDSVVLANVAYALGYFGEDIAAAIALIDRALELDPSFARGWLRSGWLRLWAGQPDLAIEHFETFIRLSPRESRTQAFMGIGIGHFIARRFEQAKPMLLLSLQENLNWAPTLRYLASCHANMGQLDEARDVVKRLRHITPMVMPSTTPFRNPEQRELFLSGLRLAAGE